MKSLIICLLFSFISIILSNKYDFSNFRMDTTYTPMTLTTLKYDSPNTCVTFEDLISFHYTDDPATANNRDNVFPENFCYSMITYNITREDFFNIINKNLNAFENYRKYMSLYLFYNRTSFTVMDDGCAGFLRNMACLYEFPSCSDNGNGTFTPLAVCESICTNYQRRCTEFFVENFCARNTSLGYCAGKAFFLSLKYLLPILITIFIYI